jgi:FtsP/CotA-like multicopper oxidase with cupredoxin domain
MVFSKGSIRKIAMEKELVCSQRRSVKNIKAKWLLVIMLAVFLVSSAATTLIHSAKAATTRSFTLYGGYLQGWGFTSSGITSPGPTIVVEQGDTVNLTLISSDGITHRFFVSYTNSSSPSSGDPESSDFSGTINFQFVASSTVGTYTYYCYHHPNVMYGTFRVVPTGTIPEFQPLMLLSLLVASTAVVALAYRRKR